MGDSRRQPTLKRGRSTVALGAGDRAGKENEDNAPNKLAKELPCAELDGVHFAAAALKTAKPGKPTLAKTLRKPAGKGSATMAPKKGEIKVVAALASATARPKGRPKSLAAAPLAGPRRGAINRRALLPLCHESDAAAPGEKASSAVLPKQAPRPKARPELTIGARQPGAWAACASDPRDSTVVKFAAEPPAEPPAGRGPRRRLRAKVASVEAQGYDSAGLRKMVRKTAVTEKRSCDPASKKTGGAVKRNKTTE